MAYNHDDPKKNSKVRNGSKLKQNNVEPGPHNITVFEILKIYWSKTELMVDEKVDAVIETVGFKAGTAVTFSFFETSGTGLDRNFGTVPVKISGDKATVSWKYPLDKIKNEFVQNASPSVYFKATVEATKEVKSPLLPVFSDLTIKVVNEGGRAIQNVDVMLVRSTGKVETFKTDGSGMVSVKKVPATCHKIKFPGSNRILGEKDTFIDMKALPAFRHVVAAGSTVQLFKLIEFFAYCSHKSGDFRRQGANTPVFEVVPDPTGKEAYKDDVVILSRTATSLTSAGKELKKLSDSYGMHAFELNCEQKFEYVPNIFSSEFWSGLKNPKEYPISGLPVPLTVKCYRPDIYKLQLKFPPLGSWSGGSKVAESTKGVISDVKNKTVPKFMKEWTSKELKAWDQSSWPKPGSSELPVSLFRNDAELKIDFLKSVGAIIDLGDMILDIVDTVQQNVPKIGWYFEFGLQLFQGTFVVEWGWKEFTDHRAFYYVGINLEIKLIEIKFEVGVGVSGYGFKVQVFVNLTGAVKVSAKSSRYSPDSDIEIAIPFGAEIIGNVGARVQAGCFAKLEGTAETGFKIGEGFLRFQQNKGWSAECALKWTGVNLKVNISGGLGKKEGVEQTSEPPKKELRETVTKDLWTKELWKPVDIGKWEWPKPDSTYSPPIMPATELHDLLVAKMKEGSNIRVKTTDGTFNGYMEYADVAKAIENKIHQRNDIRRDPKAMESLVVEIRNKLEELINENDSGFFHLKHMTMERFNLFLNGGELKRRLDKIIDPLQTIINQHAK